MDSDAVVLLVFSAAAFAVGVLAGLVLGQHRQRAEDVADRLRGFMYLGVVSQARGIGAEDIHKAFDPNGRQREEVLREWERNRERGFTRRADDTPEGGGPRPVA